MAPRIMKKLVVFDLDGTLALSKSPVDPGMSALLGELLTVVDVSVISGGGWPQFQKQLLSNLPTGPVLERLSLLPTCGTKFYRYKNDWELLYSEDFTAEQRAQIIEALQTAIAKSHFHIEQTWGEQIEDRGSQITFSALGQKAPLSAKSTWDPDFGKRQQMKAILDPLLPDFSIRLGGTTSVDITKKGIDKAYGIRKLRDQLKIAVEEMIFVGDAIFPGGNDYPAKEAGAIPILVADPGETKVVIRSLLASLGNGSREDNSR
jgi:HAD superfamily hydrolase (TIGR01484 family)